MIFRGWQFWKRPRPAPEDRTFELRPFGSSEFEKSIRIVGKVSFSRSAGSLGITYEVKGAGVASIRLPGREPDLTPLPVRKSELWKQTCFEVFLQIGNSGDYTEFNFAPSEAFDFLEFDSYRKRAPKPSGKLQDKDLHVEVLRDDRQIFQIHAELNVRALLLSRDRDAVRLGISAILDDKHAGVQTFWALKHPAKDKPDFHASDGFALELR